jgi:hypothetical protein
MPSGRYSLMRCTESLCPSKISINFFPSGFLSCRTGPLRVAGIPVLLGLDSMVLPLVGKR